MLLWNLSLDWRASLCRNGCFWLFSVKFYCQPKKKALGTWQDNIRFKNDSHIFYALYQKTLGIPSWSSLSSCSLRLINCYDTSSYLFWFWSMYNKVYWIWKYMARKCKYNWECSWQASHRAQRTSPWLDLDHLQFLL